MLTSTVSATFERFQPASAFASMNGEIATNVMENISHTERAERRYVFIGFFLLVAPKKEASDFFRRVSNPVQQLLRQVAGHTDHEPVPAYFAITP